MERHSLKYFHMMMVGAGALVLAGCGEQPWAQEEAALPTARERVDQATGERDGDKKSENLSQPKAEVSVGGEEFVGLAGVPVKVQADPEAILEALSTGKIDRANRTEELRKVVFYMECLVLAGEPSLPAIRKFLGRNEDLEFGFNSNAMKWQYQPKLPAKADPKAGAKKTTTRTRGHYVMTTEFVLPVSLRLGLFEVLARIGGNNAEKILADALEESGRGIEIATLDRLLANLAGEKYKDEVLGAVHQLLADPLEVPSPTKLDGYSRKYLFSILTKYRDETFAELAQHLIVKDNGSIDNDVVSYLNLTLGDRAMPLFANALNDPQLDPRWAGTLSSYVLKHVGSNAVADAFFHKVMTDDKLAGLRRNAFSALRYGAEKDVLQRRLDLLKEYKEKFAENRTIAPTMSWVERSLKQQLDPNYKPPQLQWKGQTLRLQGLNGGGGSLILPSGGSGTTYFKSAGEGGVIRAYRIEGNGGAGEIRVEPSIGKDGALSIRIQPPKK